MPKVRFKPLIEEIHGTLYDVVFKRSSKGNMIVTKRPDMSKVKWSQAQDDQRARFGPANEYAQAAMAEPEVRAIYEQMAAEQHRQPYRVAFSDYFKGKDLLTKR
jgi:hypothetical protein